MFNTSPRQQYGDCVMGLGVSVCLNLFINHAPCIPSLSCLPFFLYHPYMPLFWIRKIFNLLGLHSFLYTTMCISVKGGKPPIKINNREKCLLSSWKSSSFISMCAAVSKFEDWWSKCLRLFVVDVVVMERCHTHSYQVSSPWMLPLASLRSEECLWSYLMLFKTICGRHGNMMISWKWCNIYVYQVSSLYVLQLEGFRSEEAWGYLLLYTNKHVLLWFLCWLLDTDFRSHSSYQLWITLTHLVCPLQCIAGGSFVVAYSKQHCLQT